MRFEYLKRTNPKFSARFFAKAARIASPSYYNLVVKGQRRLSRDYAERFADGLKLSGKLRDYFLMLVELEHTQKPQERARILERALRLRESGVSEAKQMTADHLRIISDMLNLKLYLLAQSKNFRLDTEWIAGEFGGTLTDEDIAKRVEILFKSGLWVQEPNGRVKTVAPMLLASDRRYEIDLFKTHESLLQEAMTALRNDAGDRRVTTGRTFLVAPASIPRIRERIERFKEELEREFEDLDATNVYQLHISFFELRPEPPKA